MIVCIAVIGRKVRRYLNNGNRGFDDIVFFLRATNLGGITRLAHSSISQYQTVLHEKMAIVQAEQNATGID